ncbi:MAG: glycosyltransferase family 9 protein [Methylophilaceae bacterium]
MLEKGIAKLGWRSIRRLLAYRLSGQGKYLKTHLDASNYKKCLWLYYDVPQIGDALMDLAPRSLLHSLGISIDLYTHQHIAELFSDDQWLNTVETDPAKIDVINYDFVIASSFKWRSIKHKVIYACQLPWISIFGKFSGPEINRSLYSAKRIATIFNMQLDASELAFHACQKLQRQKNGHQINHIPHSVALAIGGIDPTRTYKHWYAVASKLKLLGIKNIVLLGNENSMAIINAMRSLHEDSFQIHNYAGKTTLTECWELMQKASIVVAADGGLMHLAITSNRPVIGLFNQAIKPIWRLPEKLIPLSIESVTRDVNDIAPDEIINMIKTAQICPSTQK